MREFFIRATGQARISFRLGAGGGGGRDQQFSDFRISSLAMLGGDHLCLFSLLNVKKYGVQLSGCLDNYVCLRTLVACTAYVYRTTTVTKVCVLLKNNNFNHVTLRVRGKLMCVPYVTLSLSRERASLRQRDAHKAKNGSR